jgi:hypothetical protein
VASFIKNLLNKWKYGEEIVVVSGLPRSGTSMMMKMLESGGLQVMTDKLREADVDNPKGYYEDERVKDLAKTKDKAWVRDARGKVLKVISFLLKDLPSDNRYRVIFMRRDVDEILASQNKMLAHRGEENPAEDVTMKEHYEKHLAQVKRLTTNLPNYDMVEIDYRAAIDDPAGTAAKVNEFLGGRLDISGMAETVDKKLYRNRKEQLEKQKN